MIDWIDAMGRSWGYQMRRRTEGKLPSLAGKVMDLGPNGAAIRGAGSQVFEECLLGDALEFHIAYQHLDKYGDRQILALHYVDPSPVKKKSHELGIPKSTYWQRLHYAHRRMGDWLRHREGPYRQQDE